MQVNPIGGQSGYGTVNQPPSVGGMQVSDFLALLLTQLRYQDPVSPLSDTEFFQQMAMLTTIEQLRSIDQSIIYQSRAGNVALAAQLMGKTVEGVDSITGMLVSGVVSEIRSGPDGTWLKVGPHLVELANVVRTLDSAGSAQLSWAAELVGTRVSGLDTADGSSVISGRVTSVAADASGIILTVEVSPEDDPDGVGGTKHIAADRVTYDEKSTAPDLLARSSWLYGRTISAPDPNDQDKLLTGVVSGLEITEDGVYANVDGTKVPLDSIVEVTS